MEGKSRLKSKTVKISVIVGILGVLETNFPILKPMMGDYYGLLFTALGMLMYWLRTKTSEPLK